MDLALNNMQKRLFMKISEILECAVGRTGATIVFHNALLQFYLECKTLHIEDLRRF